LISYVKDRPGHDLRYADASKINKGLVEAFFTFEEGLENGNLVFRKSNLVE
jgi:dTDP-D-glucose 4,6-dehydratase